MLVCEIDAKRFRFVHSPVFFRSPGPPITKTSQLLREPDAWTPRFTRWSDLPAGFGDFKRVLAQSPNVTLFKERRRPFARSARRRASTTACLARRSVLAKTALLNAHFRLNARPGAGVERPGAWFSFVSRLVAIGRERFLALRRAGDGDARPPDSHATSTSSAPTTSAHRPRTIAATCRPRCRAASPA